MERSRTEQIAHPANFSHIGKARQNAPLPARFGIARRLIHTQFCCTQLRTAAHSDVSM